MHYLQLRHALFPLETYPRLPQTSKMECFETVVNGYYLLITVVKHSILGVCGSPGYTSVYRNLCFLQNLISKNILHERKTPLKCISHKNYIVKLNLTITTKQKLSLALLKNIWKLSRFVKFAG